MVYRPSPECFDAAASASGGRLTADEINAAFQKVADHPDKLRRDGNPMGRAERLSAFAAREGERARVAAALQRRHAALNILARDRLTATLDGHMAAGLSPQQSLLAVMEGTSRAVEGGRASVDALKNAYEGRYVGELFARIQAERPHVLKALNDTKLDADVVREMAELREGGTPGKTGNEDARYLARVYADFAEMARTDLNRLGASIGKLDGWAGAQTHDDLKMLKAGKDAWVQAVTPLLDVERSFPDATPAEVQDILADMFDTLISGIPNKVSAREQGQRVNPANLAKSLGKSRVLHWKDADAALTYRDLFGYGDTVSGMVGHLRRSARLAAVMETFGPNPENMLNSLAANMQRRLAHDPAFLPDVPTERRLAMKDELGTDAGALRNALDIATGLASRPVNMTAATIGSNIRGLQSAAKLGGMVVSAALDVPTQATAGMFRGNGYFNTLFQQLDGIRKGRPRGEVAELSYLWGEGFDGMLGHIVAPAAAQDSPVGSMAKLLEKFFRLTGQTWWTDVNRATAARINAAEMGMRAKVAHADLPEAYKHVLGLNGIGAAEWDAIRQAEFRVVDGRAYITPDRIRDLPDDAVRPLVQDRLATAEASLEARRALRRMTDAKEAEWLAGRRKKLDEWTALADARLASMKAGNQIRSEIEQQLAERRIALEKAQIEEARTETELLAAARESDAGQDVRELLQGSRKAGDADKGERLVQRVSRADFRDGQKLGQRYQRARQTIRDLRNDIATIGREANKADAAASDRMQGQFDARLAELNEFADRAYTREQTRAEAAARDEAEHPQRLADILDGGRRDLEMAVRRFVADETNYGILEADAASNRFVTRGMRPGTVGGEAMRFIMQFKQFPTVFTQRVLGRALYGQRAGASVGEKSAHIGALIAGMTITGYMVMTAKDMMRGYWPPRDPADPKTWMAAMLQSGAAGLYGDFLFSETNRFGGGVLSTVAGPTLGNAADLIELGVETAHKGVYSAFGEDEKFPAARALNLLISNTPGASLFWARPALDGLFLNSMREALSPGYLKRQEQRRKDEYGQSTLPFLGDRRAL